MCPLLFKPSWHWSLSSTIQYCTKILSFCFVLCKRLGLMPVDASIYEQKQQGNQFFLGLITRETCNSSQCSRDNLLQLNVSNHIPKQEIRKSPTFSFSLKSIRAAKERERVSIGFTCSNKCWDSSKCEVYLLRQMNPTGPSLINYPNWLQFS